jgi:hypothetical protein
MLLSWSLTSDCDWESRHRKNSATGFPVRSHHLSGPVRGRTAVKGELRHRKIDRSTHETIEIVNRMADPGALLALTGEGSGWRLACHHATDSARHLNYTQFHEHASEPRCGVRAIARHSAKPLCELPGNRHHAVVPRSFADNPWSEMKAHS